MTQKKSIGELIIEKLLRRMRMPDNRKVYSHKFEANEHDRAKSIYKSAGFEYLDTYINQSLKEMNDKYKDIPESVRKKNETKWIEILQQNEWLRKELHELNVQLRNNEKDRIIKRLTDNNKILAEENAELKAKK